MNEHDIITSFDIGIKNLAYCTMRYNPYNISGLTYPIIEWGIIDIIDSSYNEGIANPICKFCKNKAYYKYIQSEKTDAEPVPDIKINICKACKNKKKYKDNETERLYTVENSSFYELAYLAIEKLDKIDFSKSKMIIIENQPKKATLKMKMIPMMLLNYFIIRYKVEKRNNSQLEDVISISASNKLTVYDGPYIECKLKGQYPRNKFYGKEYCKYLIRNDIKWLHYYNEYKKKDDLADCFLQGAWYLMSNFKNSGKLINKIEIINSLPAEEGKIKIILKNNNILEPIGKNKLLNIKENSATRSVIIDLNITKYNNLKRAYKPKLQLKECFTLSEIKYLINTIKNVTEINGTLLNSIIYYFDNVDTFIDKCNIDFNSKPKSSYKPYFNFKYLKK